MGESGSGPSSGVPWRRRIAYAQPMKNASSPVRQLGFSRGLMVAGGVAVILIVAASAWVFSGRGTTRGGFPSALANFKLPSLEGKVLGPANYKGKVILVDFWATWCGPCRLQAEILEPLYQKVHSEGVQFLAVDSGEQAEVVRQFVRQRPFLYPVLLDSNSAISDRLQIDAFPTLMIFGRSGSLVYFAPGVIDGPTLENLLRRAEHS